MKKQKTRIKTRTKIATAAKAVGGAVIKGIRYGAILFLTAAGGASIVAVGFHALDSTTDKIAARSVYDLEYAKVYKLVTLGPGPEGPLSMIEELLVDHVEHQADGSICFHEKRGDFTGCAKIPAYYLTPAE